MLIVTRKVQERILIGKDIEIVITKIRGKQVQIGVHCDKKKYAVTREKPRGKDDLHTNDL